MKTDFSKKCSEGKKEKVKVLQIITRMNTGGPAIHVSLLCKKVDHEKFGSKLVMGSVSAFEGDMSYLMQGNNAMVRMIPELQREIKPFKDIIAFLKVFYSIIKEKPVIVHTHTAKAGVIGRLATILYRLWSGKNVAIVHTFHGNIFEGYFSSSKAILFKLIEKFIAFFTDAIIAISPTQKFELIRKYRICEARKVHLIHLGFDLSPFLAAKRHKRGIFRKKWSIDDNALIVGIVGRLVAIKNHRMFLNAAKLVIDQKDRKTIKFIIIGDGEQRGVLEKYAKDLGIEDRVLFCGWEQDISKVYADLDVLALTSDNEGTPFSIIEAMAAGVPVISTEVGGVKDLIGKQEKTSENLTGFKKCRRGIMCPKNDFISFAKGIEFLLNQKMECKDHMRIITARNYVLNQYSEDKLFREIECLYEALLK